MRYFVRLPHALRRILRFGLPAVLTLALTACEFPSLTGEAPRLPLDIKNIIPADWVPIGDLQAVSVDGDAEPEWLLFYRYDGGGGNSGPIGGVIFDAELDTATGAAKLIPYKLLPDFSSGKGQGFLAERGTSRPRFLGRDANGPPNVRLFDTDGDGANDEMAIIGNGPESAFPQYVSIFCWSGSGADKGYRTAMHLYGSGGIEIRGPNSGDTGPISRIVQKTRMGDRSLLSKRTEYARQGDVCRQGAREGEGYRAERVNLDFTYRIPENPYYPEAAVLAYYLYRQSGDDVEAERYLLPKADREPLQSSLVVAAQSLPSREFEVPADDRQVLPLSLSYAGDTVVTEQAALGGALGMSTEGPVSYVDVTIEVLEDATQVTRTWRVVNVPTAEGCQDEVCWRLLGQH